MAEHGPAPSNPLRWFPEFLALTRKRIRSQARLLGLAMLVGIIAGLGAILFSVACQAVLYFALDLGAGYHPEGPKGEALVPWIGKTEHTLNPWMLLLIPTLGGIASGLIVFSLAPEAEGHGTDAVIAAYHSRQGRIRPRVPLIKIVASALTIGSGGSGGREGPIAQIGAGFGSWLADLLKLRPGDRRILMAAGMGAGIAAIFRAPLAGALFAAEVLYWSPEFEPEVIMPAGVASVVSYTTFGIFFGYGSLFRIDPGRFTFQSPLELVPYLVLALFMVVLAMIYTRTFYGFGHLFHRVKIRPHFRPAIGAFLTGVLGVVLYFLFGKQLVLAVLSFGYGILQSSLSPNPELIGVTALLLLTVSLGKILTTGLTIGSGGSGGVFGPSMVIGGCAGGALGLLFHWYWPDVVRDPGSFVIVGMAGFFAAAAKTPFSTLVIVSEMTGDYNLILPTLWVCTFSFLLSDDQSLYRSQVEGRSRSPAHQGTFVREILAGVTVSELLKADWQGPTLRPGDSLARVLECFETPDTPVLPVVDANGKLLGVIGLEELTVALQADHAQSLLLAADLMRGGIKPLAPDDPLDQAMEFFVDNDLLALPVVDRQDGHRLLGMMRRSDLASAYLRRIHAPRVEQPVAP